VKALERATRCGDCNSSAVRRRWDRRTGRWELTLAHRADCPVRRGLIAPHGIAEAATAAVSGLSYVRDAGGGSGGWVLGEHVN
jgi:hypothetical protein